MEKFLILCDEVRIEVYDRQSVIRWIDFILGSGRVPHVSRVEVEEDAA